jgi:hypothetical protein
VEVVTNSWSADDITNNEGAQDNLVDVQRTCHTILSMMDTLLLLTDTGNVSDGTQSDSNVGFKRVLYLTYLN